MSTPSTNPPESDSVPAAGESSAAPDQQPQRGRPRIESSQLPPANMTTLVSMLSTQAMVALGMIPDPSTGQPEPQPALARHFIDLLGVIEDKTRGNLSPEEHRLLDASLHELRMLFVQISRLDG